MEHQTPPPSFGTQLRTVYGYGYSTEGGFFRLRTLDEYRVQYRLCTIQGSRELLIAMNGLIVGMSDVSSVPCTIVHCVISTEYSEYIRTHICRMES